MNTSEKINYVLKKNNFPIPTPEEWSLINTKKTEDIKNLE